MTCVIRFTQRGTQRICQAMIVDAKRRLLEKIEGPEVTVRQVVEKKYPGIVYQ